MKIDIVLQGQYTDYTKFIISEYKKLDFVGKIILSSYQKVDDLVDVHQIINCAELCPTPGIGNRNLQIFTSRAVREVTSPYCIKMRTDQFIRLPSMYMMYEYWKNRMAFYRIFVLGMYRNFPYHPRDHVFWGYTTDLMDLFDIPFDTTNYAKYNSVWDIDYNVTVRTETYIGQFYYARFNELVWDHIKSPSEFLMDSAPRKQEALDLDFRIRDDLFMPFPKIDMEWPKHPGDRYYYGALMSEYWGD